MIYKHFSPTKMVGLNVFILIFVALLTLAARTVVLAFDLSDWIFYLGVILGYAGWGIFIAMHLTFVGKLLPIHLLTKGVALMMPCYYIFNGILTLVAPMIYSYTGIKEFFLILFIIQLIGCLILLFGKKTIEVEILKEDEVVNNVIE